MKTCKWELEGSRSRAQVRNTQMTRERQLLPSRGNEVTRMGSDDVGKLVGGMAKN